MDKEINDLIFNLMCDLKKRDIDPIGRARLIQKYITDNNISQRALAKRLGLPHNTLQDWLLWTKVSKTDYDRHIESGFTHTDIYNSLRGGTLGGKDKAVDLALKACISKLEIFKIRPPCSSGTKQLIGELKHILDVIESQA